jgi:iron-sulfur cluster repair protein YtfE (RIC family)
LWITQKQHEAEIQRLLAETGKATQEQINKVMEAKLKEIREFIANHYDEDDFEEFDNLIKSKMKVNE